jgi:hypothetical protein
MKTAMAFVLGAMVGVTGMLALQHFPILSGILSGPPGGPPKIRSDAVYSGFCPPTESVCK